MRSLVSLGLRVVSDALNFDGLIISMIVIGSWDPTLDDPY
jgi:hypothetical protein